MIETREFRFADLDGLVSNRFGYYAKYAYVFFDEDYIKHTILRNGDVKALVFFRHEGEDNWSSFIIVSQDFTPLDGVAVKRFLESEVSERKPKTLWTASPRDKKLERWHLFLGMEKQGVREVDGTECDLWVRAWA